MDETELNHRFPRSSRYNFEWIKEGAMGSNVLWMTEWLCERLDLRQGMRVLDLGCGKAKSSVFLAREFGVEVWATDLWIAARETGSVFATLAWKSKSILYIATLGPCRSRPNSSTPSWRLIAIPILARTTCT
ncbi:MAG TPA: hypothetical protein VGK58_12230 [Lacipirellulaceae bacterium]